MASAEIIPLHPPAELSLLRDARATLARVTTVGEVVRIRDQAEAIRQYLAVQKESLQAQNQAAEVKLWAERRAGELLAVAPKLNGARPPDAGSHDVTPLSALGVSKMQSSRWQRVASLPEHVFSAHIEATKAAGKELTTVSVLKLAAQQATTPPRPDWQGEGDVVGSLAELVAAGRKFRTIYADPPWRYGNQGTRASTDNHYQTMTVAEICAEPVRDVVEADAHLHLWTTNAFLRDAFAVMEAWGFEYKSMLVWCKPQMGIGNYWRVSHELLLFGVRGDTSRDGYPFRARDEMSWVVADRTRHSAKPDLFRQKVEKVSHGPYLEMYGREHVPGSVWTVYGNQVAGRLC